MSLASPGSTPPPPTDSASIAHSQCVTDLEYTLPMPCRLKRTCATAVSSELTLTYLQDVKGGALDSGAR